MHSMTSIEEFLADFRGHADFAWTKINHGFWETLGRIQQELGWPVAAADYARADEIAKRTAFFQDGFVEELLTLLRELPCQGLTLALELSAWPDDNRIAGTPADPEIAKPLFDTYRQHATTAADGLLLKRAIHDGSITALFDELAIHPLVVVGPQHLDGLAEFIGAAHHVHIPIHATRAREQRFETEASIAQALADVGDGAVVLLQAGTLAPYWILRMRPDHPTTKWIDGGLAFSISAPSDIFDRPWGEAYRREIATFYNSRRPNNPVEVRDLDPRIAELAEKRMAATPETGDVRFIEDKPPDHDRVRSLLGISNSYRQWANGGPLVGMLEEAYSSYMQIPDGSQITATANAGLGLEALGRVCEHRVGKPIRWGVSSFTFKNQRRGYFAGGRVIDCSSRGMLNIKRLETHIESNEIDGFVVTNVFGMWTDFSPYIALALKHSVPMLIDNAAGISASIPDWPYQAFSLHHTKPFGFGEGGLVLTPSNESEFLRQVLTYGTLDDSRALWVNNGKLSEAAAAYHLDRFERAPEWLPLYQMQGVRIARLAKRAGLQRLFNWEGSPAAMSMPFLTENRHDNREHPNTPLTLGKYYQPLGPQRVANDLYERLVNVPTHPDVAQLDESILMELLSNVAKRGSSAVG